MKLVVYGSFNCPYSLLASRRADRLIELGIADVEWRAVVHEPDIALQGEPVVGEMAALFDRELEEIRGLLRSGETYEARPPTVQPNTTRSGCRVSISVTRTFCMSWAARLRRLLPLSSNGATSGSASIGRWYRC